MKFIEVLFGVSPDNGTGSWELLLFVTPLLAAAIVLKWRRNRSRR